MIPFRFGLEPIQSWSFTARRVTAVSVSLAIYGWVAFASLIAVADERDAWTTSRVKGSPDPPRPFHVRRAYPNLQFNQPVEMMPLGDTGKMMLLEVDGKLYTFDDDQGCEEADLALDMKPLVDPFHRAFGFAVHPDFDQNRQIFVAYSGGPASREEGTRLSRFIVQDESPPRVDPASEQILLTWPSGGHNGCAIRFDSNGLLYFSTGDGSRPYPPDEYDVSQDLSDLRSAICRIDVDQRDGGRHYSIPADNPFLDTPGARPEIWAYGFRNPWRFTIDRRDDRILCGDVGWELWEMIFDVRRAGNYGWSIVEGPQPIRDDIRQGPTKIEEPLVSYPHALGQSVTGGHVYQGSDFAALKDAYIYGDYVTGLIWALRRSEDHVAWNPIIAESGLKIITFAETRDHEMLVVDFDGGIYELVENPASSDPGDFPTRLSETGLFETTSPLRPAAGVLPYQLIAESTQEGTVSDYVVGIPDRGTVKINKRQRNWNYPSGTVFARTIRSTSGTKLETQLIHFDGSDWKPYSYAWNAEQSDAELVAAEGATIEVVDDSGHASSRQILSRAQCRTCHSRQNGGAVGFTLANLDRSGSDSGDNQLDRLISHAVIDRRAPKAWNIRPLVDPHDASASLQDRARSYLSAHCAHCHVRGGGGTVPLDLSYENDNDGINAINFATMQGNFGISDAKVITPGDPSRSVLFYRMATSGTGHMPKLGARDNDLFGLKLVHDWIESLGDAPKNDDPEIGDASQVLQHTSESLRVFAMLMKQADGERKRVMAEASENGNPVTRGLFERFLPEQRRRKTLGESIHSEAILAMRGDTRRGRELFFAPASQCIQCHRLQGSGQSVGPDLDSIASKRNRPQLLDSIVSPSKEIEPKFRSHAVLTEDGAIVTGLKISESNESIVIRQPNGKDITISQEDVVSAKVQTQSLMPTGLAAPMTAQELADLLAFLESLK